MTCFGGSTKLWKLGQSYNFFWGKQHYLSYGWSWRTVLGREALGDCRFYFLMLLSHWSKPILPQLTNLSVNRPQFVLRSRGNALASQGARLPSKSASLQSKPMWSKQPIRTKEILQVTNRKLRVNTTTTTRNNLNRGKRKWSTADQ